MRRYVVLLGVGLVAASVIRTLGPREKHIATVAHYAVPDVDTMLVRTASDTLFSHLGVSLDSVVLSPDSLLHLHVQGGMLVRPMDVTESSCSSGPVAYPATRYVAERMYSPYARDRAIKGIVVHTRSDSVVDAGWFSRRQCGPSGGAAYFYRPELDSLLVRSQLNARNGS